MMVSMILTPFTGTRGLGILSVTGRRRFPCPAAMIIAFVNALKEEGINYQTDAFIVAQDISYTATLMCYIQISLLRCAGVVICGNSLTQPPIESQTFLE